MIFTCPFCNNSLPQHATRCKVCGTRIIDFSKEKTIVFRWKDPSRSDMLCETFVKFAGAEIVYQSLAPRPIEYNLNSHALWVTHESPFQFNVSFNSMPTSDGEDRVRSYKLDE